MKTLPKDITASKAQKIGQIIDHLVDALGGEPSCTIRRAVILADIDEFPGTTQAEIMARLEVDKSTLNRDIEWLYDYGCITRGQGSADGREIPLQICGYSRKSLGYALESFEFSHKSLKNFLITFISLFREHKPTLRDAKILALAGDVGGASRQDIAEGLYSGPSTTESRALSNLIELGIVKEHNDGKTT